MTLIIAIYFVINSFLAGYYLGSKIDRSPIFLLSTVLFGCIISIVGVILGVLSILWTSIRKRLHIKFFYLYYIKGEYRDMLAENLYKMNSMCRKYHNGVSISDRIWGKCVELINKRNNYTFIEKKGDLDDR